MKIEVGTYNCNHQSLEDLFMVYLGSKMYIDEE